MQYVCMMVHNRTANCYSSSTVIPVCAANSTQCRAHIQRTSHHTAAAVLFLKINWPSAKLKSNPHGNADIALIIKCTGTFQVNIT